MRGVWLAMMAAVGVPLAGLAARPTVHVEVFAPQREPLRIQRAASASGASFEDMVAKAARPRIAFNGTFYGTDGRPLGLLRADGRWVYRNGHMRTVFAVDDRGRALLTSRDAVRRAPGRYPFALAAGPRLLTGGKVTLNPEAEGFRSAARRRHARRLALGVRKDGAGLVILEERAVTLAEFAETCRRAGAVDAVNLDGGSATALYRNGAVVVSPIAPMSNIVTVGGSPRR